MGGCEILNYIFVRFCIIRTLLFRCFHEGSLLTFVRHRRVGANSIHIYMCVYLHTYKRICTKQFDRTWDRWTFKGIERLVVFFLLIVVLSERKLSLQIHVRARASGTTTNRFSTAPVVCIFRMLKHIITNVSLHLRSCNYDRFVYLQIR